MQTVVQYDAWSFVRVYHTSVIALFSEQLE